MQYPYKIVANPWDLAANDKICGFSGTNDSKLLLPLQVQQKSLEACKGTNAKMIELLLQNTQEILFLESNINIVDLCIQHKVNALIDVGA